MIMKTAKQLERYFKGASNHWRIKILFLLEKNGGLDLEEIAQRLKCNIKNISQHTGKLVQAGLLNKRYVGRRVSHSLSPYGKRFVRFMKTF
jgi:DNA-binding MarR family transcriptional regulator